MRVTTERLRIIAELIDRGELKTRVGAILPLADARDAHMMLEGVPSPPKGKIVLNVEAAGEGTASLIVVRSILKQTGWKPSRP